MGTIYKKINVWDQLFVLRTRTQFEEKNTFWYQSVLKNLRKIFFQGIVLKRFDRYFLTFWKWGPFHKVTLITYNVCNFLFCLKFSPHYRNSETLKKQLSRQSTVPCRVLDLADACGHHGEAADSAAHFPESAPLSEVFRGQPVHLRNRDQAGVPRWLEAQMPVSIPRRDVCTGFACRVLERARFRFEWYQRAPHFHCLRWVDKQPCAQESSVFEHPG